MIVSDGKEERQPDAKGVRRVDVRVVERHGRTEDGGDPRVVAQVVVRTGVGTRPVLPRVLKPQLVGHAGRKERDEAAVHRVGPVLFQAVCTGAPRVHVERAVLLLGPRVVVLERQVVTVRQPKVELGERRPRIVGAGDRPEIVAQLRVSAREECCERVERRRMGPVVGDEIKRPVALERTAQREPKLILGKVGVESLDLARR